MPSSKGFAYFCVVLNFLQEDKPFLIFGISDNNTKFDTMQSQNQLSLTCAFKFTTHVIIADKKSEIEYS